MSKMRFAGTRKRNKYRLFRREHFLPDEAWELSRIRNLRTAHELPIMVRERRILWRTFNEEVTQSHWSPTKQKRMWKHYVHVWYLREGYVAKKIGLARLFAEGKEVWIWLRATSSLLPEEKRYPRNSYRSTMSEAARTTRAQREATKEEHNRMLDVLMKRAAKEPARDRELTELATRVYEFTGKSLYQTALRRGYA